MYLNIIFKYKKKLINNYTTIDERYRILIMKLVKIKKELVITQKELT